MKSVRRWVSCCWLLPFCVAHAVEADTIIASNGPYQLLYTDPVAVGSVEGLIAVTLKVVNTTGIAANNPFFFEGQIGLSGLLHHEQFATPIPPFGQLTTPTALTSGGSTVDSHFIYPAALTVSPESEPLINDSTSAEPGNFDGLTGFGGPLSARIGFGTSANPTPSTVSLAYLVLKSNVGLDFDFVIGGSVGGAGAFRFQGCLGPYDCGADAEPPEIQPQLRQLDLRFHTNTIDDLQLLAIDNATHPGALVWSNLAYAAGPGKFDPSATEALMDADGIVNWNPAGWRQGEHLFHATVEDLAGNQVSGLALTVNLVVPEPGTYALASFLGVAAFVVRRRT